MNTVCFITKEAEIIFTMPSATADIELIVWCFTFINRTYAPTYNEMFGCLAKGLASGVIRRDRERYHVDASWYSRIHSHDSDFENEIESMLAFEEWFAGPEFDVIGHDTCNLSKAAYDQACANVNSRWPGKI